MRRRVPISPVCRKIKPTNRRWQIVLVVPVSVSGASSLFNRNSKDIEYPCLPLQFINRNFQIAQTLRATASTEWGAQANRGTATFRSRNINRAKVLHVSGDCVFVSLYVRNRWTPVNIWKKAMCVCQISLVGRDFPCIMQVADTVEKRQSQIKYKPHRPSTRRMRIKHMRKS
ncbi:hypothetical protein K439DRAFT_959942 [Ramaria rubella]|nr:hypothetical protein K439DRAFT_959942 [Ramaria rubella]